MFAPRTDGRVSTFDAPNQSRDYGFLHAGRWYVVTRAFADYDGDTHPVGETWRFCGSSYLPYDDGLSLFVSLDGAREWHIRMQGADENQGLILRDLEAYIAPVPPAQHDNTNP